MKKILSLILCLCLMLAVFAACGKDGADDNQDEPQITKENGDVAILYTNDVHTYIDGPLSYDVIAALKSELKSQYAEVLLVDAGDHSQGTAYGAMDSAESVISLMNAAGYDAATFGNHEFDYGMSGAMKIIDWAQYGYLSCNFYNIKDGVRLDNVVDSYRIFECGDQMIAFVGITTPETFTKSTPAYFQDDEGEYIYGISGGNDGAALYKDVQDAVDAAINNGATKVIALGHLGDEEIEQPWKSADVIANVSGLDAFIDGHSHSVIEGQAIVGGDGEEVLLTQTGEYFNRIGLMVIDGESGEITTDFIECVELTEPALDEDGEEYDKVIGYELSSELYTEKTVIFDEKVAALKNAWITEVDSQLETVIGKSNVILDNYIGDQRLVRMGSTNSGDFAADALYHLFDEMEMDVDVAVMNGGGVRNGAISGELTYKTCKEIHTFGNVACLLSVTGQQLLDALEWGAISVGSAENGSLLHVAGATYKVDTTVEATVTQDEYGVWTGAPSGSYRVYDVMVYDRETQEYKPLELDAVYNLAGYNYTLRDLGGGFAMFDGAENVLDYVMEDYMVLANYVSAFPDQTLDAANSPLLEKYPSMLLDYGDVNGSGRIETTGE